MSNQKPDFEQRVQEILQASTEQLDGATRSRLTQARHAALDAIKQRQSQGWHWLMPAMGVAAAAVVAVLAFNQPRPVVQNAAITAAITQGAATSVDAMDIVTAEDSLEFYRDAEFYAWFDTVSEEAAVVPENEA